MSFIGKMEDKIRLGNTGNVHHEYGQPCVRRMKVVKRISIIKSAFPK
jgi:hypothetical protein